MPHFFYRTVYFCFWAFLFTQIYAPSVEIFWLVISAFMVFAFLSNRMADVYMNTYNAKAFGFWVFNPLVYVAIFIAEHYKTFGGLYDDVWPFQVLVLLGLFVFYCKSYSKDD